MSAATKARNTDQRPNLVRNYPLAAATVIFLGTMVALNAAGNAVPASDTAALRVVGLAEATVDNTAGAAGDLTIDVKRGTFKLENSAAQPLVAASKEKLCFVEDDQIVALTSTNLIVAGRVVEIDPDLGVWVEIGFPVAKHGFALTSTNGTAAAAADDAALKAEAEKIGDDVRALHAAIFG